MSSNSRTFTSFLFVCVMQSHYNHVCLSLPMIYIIIKESESSELQVEYDGVFSWESFLCFFSYLLSTSKQSILFLYSRNYSRSLQAMVYFPLAVESRSLCSPYRAYGLREIPSSQVCHVSSSTVAACMVNVSLSPFALYSIWSVADDVPWCRWHGTRNDNRSTNHTRHLPIPRLSRGFLLRNSCLDVVIPLSWCRWHGNRNNNRRTNRTRHLPIPRVSRGFLLRNSCLDVVILLSDIFHVSFSDHRRTKSDLYTY